MSLGTAGHSLYIGSLWSFQLHGTRWFVILAFALLGLSAALFLAAQGSIMMSYPLEKDKGRSFTVFWVIFQTGTLVGAAIALGIQSDSVLPGVSTAVYATFVAIVLTAVGHQLARAPPPLRRPRRRYPVELQSHIGPPEELRAFGAMFRDWRMLALAPMFFSSNYF
jgi:MFS family permease